MFSILENLQKKDVLSATLAICCKRIRNFKTRLWKIVRRKDKDNWASESLRRRKTKWITAYVRRSQTSFTNYLLVSTVEFEKLHHKNCGRSNRYQSQSIKIRTLCHFACCCRSYVWPYIFVIYHSFLAIRHGLVNLRARKPNLLRPMYVAKASRFFPSSYLLKVIYSVRKFLY